MMKSAAFCLLVAGAFAYQDIPASYNFDEVLKDKTKLHDFFGCFLDKNPCTETTSHIKNHLKELILDGCRECDLRQRHYAHVLTSALKDKYPQDYKEYRAKYDPQGKYFSKFEDALVVLVRRSRCAVLLGFGNFIARHPIALRAFNMPAALGTNDRTVKFPNPLSE
ncbi:ejaculatory bulb-specific protein 3-like [Aricia agestis]|uniref:ejaculatory bulb-specific protein 3-like n=1 Tax=Aricia agestis TaxID=91739 RepID=UPI001C20B951|nr:ejaculatory bulb-specific protein 3-like [Aricia agestis]